MDQINLKVALEVTTHEGLVRQAYKDSEGVWTWSIGITSKSGHRVERYKDNPQTLEYCLEVFIWLLKRYAAEVVEVFGDTLNEAQFAAALSFHWNTGAIKKASWPALFKKGDMAGARAEFMLYKKPSSIIGRRTKEADLLFNGKWSQDGKTTEYTKVTSSYTPNWGSAVRIDIRSAMQDALDANGLGNQPSLPIDDPQPSPETPVLPEPVPESPEEENTAPASPLAGETAIRAMASALQVIAEEGGWKFQWELTNAR